MSRGRKKKTNVILDDESNFNFSQLSISEEMLAWEYRDDRTSTTVIEKIPLSKKANERYWTEKLHSRGPVAKMMLTKIANNSEPQSAYICDRFKKNQLLSSLIQTVSELCVIKNIPRRVAYEYIYAINSILNFFAKKYENINAIDDVSNNIQIDLRKELSNRNSLFFKSMAQKSHINTIFTYALNNFKFKRDITNVFSQKLLLRKNDSGIKSKADLSQEVAVQLLAASIGEINKIIENYNMLEKEWRPSYKNKKFDSPENLANAYLNYPQHFKLISKRSFNSSIVNYRKKYDELCNYLHGFKLSGLENEKLKLLASKGENIHNLNESRMMSWFLDDVLSNYPLQIDAKITKHTLAMSEYTRWKYKSTVKTYLSSLSYEQNQKKAIEVFREVLAIKFPTAEKIFPFMLYWLLQTGANQEVLFNMNWRQKFGNKLCEIDENSPFGDIPVLRSYKNRGTKNWYWFPLNPNEKNGLYDMYMFLKKYLKPLWDFNASLNISNSFWVFIVSNQAHGSYNTPIKHFNQQVFKNQLTKFLERNEIISIDGQRLKNFEPSRIRNTFITTADLNGLTLDEIKESIRHGSFDTRFHYYGNSADQRSRNFGVIHAIQESIIESAKNFKGKVYSSKSSRLDQKKLHFSFLSGCSDNKHPNYEGMSQINETEVCIDWDNCLACKNSRVFKVHLPRICFRLMQYAKFQDTMSADEWENNYGMKYAIAQDVLTKWIENGGSKDDIEWAWNEAKFGKIKLPQIFPQGFMKTNIKTEELVG